MDREIMLWANAGKSVVLRFSASGWKKWKEPWSQQGTPEWAFRNYRIRKVMEIDGAVLPVYWDEGFLKGLEGFLQEVSKHLQENHLDQKVAFIEIAVGDGGETKPDTEQNKTPEQRAARLSLWQQVGYTNAIWYRTVGSVIEVYKQAFPSIPLALMPDGSFLGGECTLPNGECREKQIVALANQKGLILQDNGFDRTHIYPAEWHNGHPLVCEQRESATKMNYPLHDDLVQSVKAGCASLLVFRQDLKRPDFQQQIIDFYKHCGE
jgi:hypothetical protein